MRQKGQTVTKPTKFGSVRTMLAALISLTLLTGCGVKGFSAPIQNRTAEAICQELEKDLPTYHEDDTPQTLEQGGNFLLGTFPAVCGSFL